MPEQTREDVQLDFRRTFGTPHGIRVLNRLSNYCYARKSTSAGARDIYEVMRNEGRREAYLEIQHIINEPLGNRPQIATMEEENATGRADADRDH